MICFFLILSLHIYIYVTNNIVDITCTYISTSVGIILFGFKIAAEQTQVGMIVWEVCLCIATCLPFWHHGEEILRNYSKVPPLYTWKHRWANLLTRSIFLWLLPLRIPEDSKTLAEDNSQTKTFYSSWNHSNDKVKFQEYIARKGKNFDDKMLKTKWQQEGKYCSFLYKMVKTSSF